MVDVIIKLFCYTIFSVTPSYYFRNLFWGSLLFAVPVYIAVTSPEGVQNWKGVFIIGGTLLFYPYTRLAYDYIMDLFFSGMGMLIPMSWAFFWYMIRTGLLVAVTPFVAPIVLIFFVLVQLETREGRRTTNKYVIFRTL